MCSEMISHVTAETVGSVSRSDVTSLVADQDRRAELRDLQSELMLIASDSSVSESTRSAAVELIVASVDTLIWSKLHSMSSYIGQENLDDAYQVAVTRLLSAISLYSEGKYGDPVAYLTSRCEFAARDARSSAATARKERAHLLREAEVEVALGERSPHNSFGSFDSEIAVRLIERVCSLGSQIGSSEAALLSSPSAFWAVRNAERFGQVSESATITSRI